MCHVLLIETPTGLALVDSGLGLRDAAQPARRFGPARHFVRPAFDEAESAVRQIAKLGYDPRDVQDIILTHFDADHTGGLADFPWARVHLTAAEDDASLHPITRVEKGRYVPAHREHSPIIVRHTPKQGESWHGFGASRELAEIAPGIILVALPGHSRGHAAVAVDDGDRWVLHVGDAFYHHGQIDGTAKPPKSLLAMERVIAQDWAKVRSNHERLAELWRRGDSNILLVNAHDPTLLHLAQQSKEN